MSPPFRRGPTPSADDARTLRARMVCDQLRHRGISDERILAAFGRVPRHRFVDTGDLAARYGDEPLPIPCGQTISQPYIVALSLQAAALRPEHQVLEIGAGSGYQTALLAELVDQVQALEYYPDLTHSAGQRLRELGYVNVDLRCGDGQLGWPDGGSFDAIVGAAAAPRIPEALIAQLRPGGCLVMPEGTYIQHLVRLRRTAAGLEREALARVRFVPLLGDA